MMKTLSVKIPEPLAKWLVVEARQKGSSRSEIVREALEQKRNGHAGGAKGAKKPRTMADALLDAGPMFKGPGDLNTNPKYWDDFGK